MVDDGGAAPLDLDYVQGKEKVRVPKHVTHVEKLDMFPKTVGMEVKGIYFIFIH